MESTLTAIDVASKLAPAFITLVVGITASYISYLHYKINKEKLRLDLFQRRLEAYEKLQQFLSMVLQKGSVANEDIPVLTEAKYKSRFIFGSEIAKYLDTIWDKAFVIRAQQRKLDGEKSLPIGDERNRVCEDNSEDLKWMADQMRISWTHYQKYLTFFLR